MNIITDILIKVKKMNRKTEKQYAEDVEKILRFFEKNYSKNIKFADVMHISDIGENNFKKYFKSITGTTVMHYFKKYKISRAKELIEKNQYSFTEISLILGYDSIHYFSRQFKSIEGISPTEYKTQIKQRKE